MRFERVLRVMDVDQTERREGREGDRAQRAARWTEEDVCASGTGKGGHVERVCEG